MEPSLFLRNGTRIWRLGNSILASGEYRKLVSDMRDEIMTLDTYSDSAPRGKRAVVARGASNRKISQPYTPATGNECKAKEISNRFDRASTRRSDDRRPTSRAKITANAETSPAGKGIAAWMAGCWFFGQPGASVLESCFPTFLIMESK